MADSRDKKPASQNSSDKSDPDKGAKVLSFSDHRRQRAQPHGRLAARRPTYTAPSDEDPDPGPSAA